MDQTSPSPPPHLADISDSEIEIPEPDYNDDSDDDVADPASGCHDDKPDEASQSETCAADDDDGEEDSGQVEVDQGDNEVEKSFDFDDVRAKLEAFSREQQLQLRGSVSADADEDVEIPEPDYSDSDDAQPVDDESQLISAKKLVNPCLESKEHKAVRQELAFNQKLGINVLDKKTELRKEMDKRKQRQQKQDDYQRHRENRSSFELRLEQQANKLNLAERDGASSDRSPAAVSPTSEDVGRHPASEFRRVHAKISQPKSAS